MRTRSAHFSYEPIINTLQTTRGPEWVDAMVDFDRRASATCHAAVRQQFPTLSAFGVDLATDRTMIRLWNHSPRVASACSNIGDFLSNMFRLMRHFLDWEGKSARTLEQRRWVLATKSANDVWLTRHSSTSNYLADESLEEALNDLLEELGTAYSEVCPKATQVLVAIASIIQATNGLHVKDVESPSNDSIQKWLRARGIKCTSEEIITARKRLRDVAQECMQGKNWRFAQSRPPLRST